MNMVLIGIPPGVWNILEREVILSWGNMRGAN
jgi:hypothetical protein